MEKVKTLHAEDERIVGEDIKKGFYRIEGRSFSLPKIIIAIRNNCNVRRTYDYQTKP